MFEGRRNVRIKDNIRVRWQMEKHFMTGEGTIVELSAHGLQLVLDKIFEPPQGCVFLIEPLIGAGESFGPKRLKIVWFKKVTGKKKEFIKCGGEFVQEP